MSDIERLAKYLHEHIDYGHPDAACDACPVCREHAEMILKFLVQESMIVSDVEICM